MRREFAAFSLRRGSRCRRSPPASTEYPATSAPRTGRAAPGLADGADAIQLREHPLRRHHARADARRLRDIHQHRGQLVVLVGQRHAALQVRGVLAARPASAPLRSRRRVRTAHRPRSRRHRDCGSQSAWIETKMSARGLARQVHAFAQRNEAVVVARQIRLHAGLGVDASAPARARSPAPRLFRACRWRRWRRDPGRHDPHRWQR